MKEIIIGLVLLMIANILLGLTLGELKEEFDKTKLIKGIKKVVYALIGMAFVYGAGCLNPDILVININNMDMNIMDSMKTLFIMGIAMYGYQDLSKIINILKIKVSTSGPTHYVEEPDEVVEEPKESEEDEITISR